jgi:hypothetical protein
MNIALRHSLDSRIYYVERVWRNWDISTRGCGVWGETGIQATLSPPARELFQTRNQVLPKVVTKLTNSAERFGRKPRKIFFRRSFE